MKDLVMERKNENSQVIKQEYNRIFDFTEEFGNNKVRYSYAGLW